MRRSCSAPQTAAPPPPARPRAGGPCPRSAAGRSARNRDRSDAGPAFQESRSADGRSRPASPCPRPPRPDRDQARPRPPAQRRTRGASPALTRYASCREPHAPPEPGVAPAAFQSPPSLLRQTLSSSTPSSRITCTPQDKTAAPAVTPPSTPARESGRGGAMPGTGCQRLHDERRTQCIVNSHRGPRRDPEHGEPAHHPLEVGQRRVLVHGDVDPGIRRPPQVGLQDGRAPLRGDLLEAHLLSAAVAQRRVTACRPDVAHPVHALPKHGHEVALAPHVSHDCRQAHGPAGPPARDLQGDQVVRTDPRAESAAVNRSARRATRLGRPPRYNHFLSSTAGLLIGGGPLRPRSRAIPSTVQPVPRRLSCIRLNMAASARTFRVVLLSSALGALNRTYIL